MNNIYLNYVGFSGYASLQPVLPRYRFLKYYHDLYAMHHQQIDFVTFIQGDQGDYPTLGKLVLDTCTVDGNMREVDTLICATWSHEFDPIYSSCGPYFSHRYQIPNVFDVTDQGTLSTFTSIKILLKMLTTNDCQRGAVLGLEQTTIPRNIEDHAVMPTMSGAGLLILSTTPQEIVGKKIRFIAADILPEHNVLNSQYHIWPLLKNHFAEHAIDENKVSLVIKKKSTLAKANLKYQYQNKTIPLDATIKYFSNHDGLLPFYYYLDKLSMLSELEAKYIVLLDEDVESVAVGMIIMEIIK